MGEDFRELLFLGLSKKQEGLCQVMYKQQGLRRLTELVKVCDVHNFHHFYHTR